MLQIDCGIYVLCWFHKIHFLDMHICGTLLDQWYIVYIGLVFNIWLNKLKQCLSAGVTSYSSWVKIFVLVWLRYVKLLWQTWYWVGLHVEWCTAMGVPMRLRVHLIKGPLEVQERKEKWGKQKLGYVVPAHNCCKLFIFAQQAGAQWWGQRPWGGNTLQIRTYIYMMWRK